MYQSGQSFLSLCCGESTCLAAGALVRGGKGVLCGLYTFVQQMIGASVGRCFLPVNPWVYFLCLFLGNKGKSLDL